MVIGFTKHFMIFSNKFNEFNYEERGGSVVEC